MQRYNLILSDVIYYIDIIYHIYIYKYINIDIVLYIQIYMYVTMSILLYLNTYQFYFIKQNYFDINISATRTLSGIFTRLSREKKKQYLSEIFS